MQILERSINALELAKLVTAGLPVPGLSLVLDSALSIAKKAKEVEDTRDDCRALAERAATLVLAVYQQLKNGSGETAAKEHVTTFLQNLQDIENLMARRLRARQRGRFMFVIKHGKIAKEVKALTAKLDESYRHFLIQTALVIDQSLDTLTSGNIRMMRHIDDSARVGEVVLGETRVIRTGISDLADRVGGNLIFDGTFRYFARENLAFLEPIADSSYKPQHTNTPHNDDRALAQATAEPRTGRVRLYRYRAAVKAAGDLTGTQVVVCAYPSRDDQRFVQDLNAAKRTRNPYVLSVLGYSRPGDPCDAAYIVTEDHLPFANYLSSLRGSDKLRAYLKMRAAICMAVDHMETMELRRLLPLGYGFWESTAYHNFALDELVIDHRNGGCIKWARDPLTLEDTAQDSDKDIDVPVEPNRRMCIVKDLRAVACERIDVVVQRWLLRIFKPLELHYFFVPSRSWRRCWEKIADCPRYLLGVWLGRKTACEDWTVLSARNPEVEAGATKAQRVPQVLPGPRQDYRDFEQRFSTARLLDIPKSDEAEMRVEFELGTGENQTRWSRYKLSCVPVDTTLVFLQRVHALHGFSEAASRMARFLPDPSVTDRYACIGMATHRFYHTETTITMSTRAAAQGVPPLWFFLLQFDGGESSAHGRNIPCGFWSLEKYPTSVPAGVIFDPTPQFEPIRKGEVAPLLTSTQILGDLVFTTETKMSITFLQLSEDELLTLRELQESLCSTSKSDAGDSDESGADGFATHDNSDEDNNGDGAFESSGSGDRPATEVRSESTDSDYQDMTDSEYDDTEEYYSAEEY